MNDFLNPYIAGAPVVEPSMFFGRQDVFDWIEQNLSGRFVNHILVIHGQRRVGKTSVLKQIPNHLPSHFIHIFFDLQGRTHTSLDRFQWWLAREICRAVSQARGQSIPIPDYELFVQDNEYMAATFLPEVLSKLGESILLLTFDEFDSLSEPEIQQSLTRPLIAYLRRLFDLPKLNFIFSIGSSGHKLENMQASYTEFFKTALYRKISFLKQEDCSRLVTRPVEGVLIYEPAAVERIYAITSGHPYFTQLICHELFSLSQKTGSRTLTREDVESVLEDVIERGTVNLKFVWDEASDLEKWVLSSLAHELHAQELDRQAHGSQSQVVCNDKQLATALHNQRVRYSENDLNTALVHLREKDVLTQENSFVVELLCIWLLKNRPLDRVRDELVQVNPIANRYNEIGDEFREIGQRDKALESFRQALSTDPSNLRAQVSIANLYLEGDNYIQAVQGYEAALRIDDDDIAARSGLCTSLLALGETAAAAGELAEAGEYYQRVLTDNPDHPEAHQRLAALFARQAEEVLATGDAELALQHYAHAQEHAPEDSQLAARYAHAKEEHTKRLIDSLLKQSQQAQEQQDWNTALDAIKRALQLAPNDPALLIRLAAVQDAPRLAQISSLRAHAQEMERDQRWDEAVQNWEACLQLKPKDEENVRQSLQVARRGQKMASDYIQAQTAIKEGRYSQAIALLQGVIVQDAAYKDAASLLVECLKARPKRELKLPKLPNLPARWWHWAVPALILVVVIIGVATQWSRLSTLLAGIGQSKTPIATQAAIGVPQATASAAQDSPPPTMTATGWEFNTLTGAIEKMTGGKAPDVEDDFSSASLQEYWNNDKGAKSATLQDGALRLNNEALVGDDVLKRMNYLLQVDLRFDKLSENEIFVYGLRITEFQNGKYGTEYHLNVWPAKGVWELMEITDPYGQYAEIQKGNFEVIEAGRWYELGVVVDNETIQVYWDDKLLLSQDNIHLFGTLNHFGIDPSTAGNATLDIDNWHFWDLGVPERMRSDWITEITPTVGVDNFTGGEGWRFNPVENEKFENGRAVLFTNGNDTFFSREDFQGTNVAMEATFIPRDMPDSASLAWFLRVNTTINEMFIYFEYFPGTGLWQIVKVDNGDGIKLASGSTQTIPKDTMDTIMVVINGDRISAFLGGTFLGSVESSFSGAGIWNSLNIRSNGAPFAQVDILKIRFWNLDAVEWKTSDWITSRPETVLIDSFTGKEGLKFSPAENERYVDGRAVLWTIGGETGLTRDDLMGENIALEVSFVPRDMPDSAYLVWFLGQDSNSDRLEFNYSPKTGAWQICKVENQQWIVLSSGTTQPTPSENAMTIMVVAEADQVRVFMNQVYLGSADIDRSGAGTWNELVVRNKENLWARVDVYLIRFWDLGTAEQASGEGSDSFTETINKITGGKAPDMQDDFSGTTLGEYWNADDGAKEATLLDGALRLNNVFPIGKMTLPRINYLLQVDLRFGGLTGDENFIYYMRVTTTPYVYQVTGYQLTINPSKGTWLLMVLTDPNGKYTEVQKGTLEAIETERWYELGIVMMNETLWVYWDNQLLFTQNNVNIFGNINHFGLDPATAGEATLDIDNWRFWDLGVPEWMRSNWVTESAPTFAADNFTGGEGWFTPPENGKFENGRLVLFRGDAESGTSYSREDFQGTNVAMEVTFSPHDLPDDASLIWGLSKNNTSGDAFIFQYNPGSGFWEIDKFENQEWNKLLSGWTQTTPQDNISSIMVVVNGDRVSAFYGDAFLGSVESSLSGAGKENSLGFNSSQTAFGQVDILKIGFWDLDAVEWKTSDWITARPETVLIDSFTGVEGLQFNPAENEKYEEGRAVLFTNGGETGLTRDDFQGKNIAVEVSFVPRDMPDSASLAWFLGQDTTTKDRLEFSYSPKTGSWWINKGETQQWELLSSGTTTLTSEENGVTIIVVAEADQVRVFMNQVYLGSADIDRSGAGTWNELVIREKENLYARADVYLIRFWDLGK
jgi:tetratricopeptide (TPR) repeat protein